MWGVNSGSCLTYETETRKVYLDTCKEKLTNQKWVVESVNEEALKKWSKTAPFPD